MKHHLLRSIGIALVFVSCMMISSEAVEIVQISQIPVESMSYHPTIAENRTVLETSGPIAPNLGVAEINFLDGPLWKTRLISFILESRNLHFLIPLVQIDIEGLSFSIRYSFDIPDIPVMRRFAYSTSITEDETPVVYNESHTVIVTGFDGLFIMTRAKPLRLTPAYFLFTGDCDNALILT